MGRVGLHSLRLLLQILRLQSRVSKTLCRKVENSEPRRARVSSAPAYRRRRVPKPPTRGGARGEGTATRAGCALAALPQGQLATVSALSSCARHTCRPVHMSTKCTPARDLCRCLSKRER